MRKTVLPLQVISVAFLSVLFCLLAGCQSPELYQEQAVDRARNFLFNNARELDARDIAYIRFSKPVFLVEPILSGTDDFTEMRRNLGNAKIREAKITQERSQICITWLIPGKEQAYLVCGVSSKNLMYWQPLKLVRRTLKAPDAKLQTATNNARQLILSDQSGSLLRTDYDFIRFGSPEVKRGRFDWSAGQAQAAEKTDGKVQFVLFWNSKIKTDGAWVVVGASDDDALTNWTAIWSGYIKDAELDEFTFKPSPSNPDTERNITSSPVAPQAPAGAEGKTWEEPIIEEAK